MGIPKIKDLPRAKVSSVQPDDAGSTEDDGLIMFLGRRLKNSEHLEHAEYCGRSR